MRLAFGLEGARPRTTGRALRVALAASTMMAGSLVAAQAYAQAASPVPASPALATPPSVEEVVVTAQKRAERLQDVPVAVSALSGKQLTEQHMTKVDDIVSFVPALHVTSPDGEGTPIFSLRGVSMSDYSLTQDGPVATYFDEVYRGAFALMGLSMYDLERVEVLRGPQGTLYGKNTTGGAVNIISQKPHFDTDGQITVGYGNYNHFQADGHFNAALSDTLAIRLAFTDEQADGWMTDALPGKPKLDSADGYAGRLSLLYRPSDKAQFILRLSGSRQNPVNYGVKGSPSDTLGIGGSVYNAFGLPGYFPPANLGKYAVQNDFAGHRLAETWSASLTSDIQLPHQLAITSVTSWDWGKLFIPDDSDGSPLAAISQQGTARAWQVAQDLRLTSSFSGPFNFILGAYFNTEHISNSTIQSYFTDIEVGCGTYFPVDCRLKNSFDQIKTSEAVYTDLKYALTDHITLRGGLRYTHDEGRLDGYESQFQDASGNFLGYLIQPNQVAAEGADHFDTSNVSGKAGIDYKTAGGQLFYVSWSRGYRGSGFNALAFFSPTEVTVAKPETLDDIEGGAKLQLFDRRVILNLSAFDYDYQNMQFINVVNALQQLVNLPKAQVYGGEIELAVRASRALSLRAGLSVLASDIQDGELQGMNLKGHQLMNAPRASLTLGADWTVADLQAGTIALHGDATVTSRQYFDVFNSPAQSQSAYGLVNGGLDFRAANHKWGVGLWAKNIFNEYYYTYRLAVPFVDENYQHVGQPRTFGATLSYSF